MYTHCPHCDTCFRVTTEQLKAARGHVRCGRCFGTFNALEHLVDEPPQPETPPPALTPATSTAKPTPAPQPAPVAQPEPVKELATEAVAATTPPPATVAAAAPAVPHPAREAQVERSQLLVEEIQSVPAKPGRNLLWLWLGLAIALTLLLTGQYAYFNLATLAQHQELRPALTALCGIARCEVPLIKAPYMITLVERDIRNDPERQNVLLVKARISNTAPYTQAYPLMELSLHDITGHVIAARRFSPSEYLTSNIDQKQGMASQQMVDILLELADPGKEAVGFEFAFF